MADGGDAGQKEEIGMLPARACRSDESRARFTNFVKCASPTATDSAQREHIILAIYEKDAQSSFKLLSDSAIFAYIMRTNLHKNGINATF